MERYPGRPLVSKRECDGRPSQIRHPKSSINAEIANMLTSFPIQTPNLSTDSSLQGLRVLMFVQRNWGITIGHPIAMRLSKKGARLSAIVEKKGTFEFVNSQTDVKYEHILSYEEIMNDPARFIDDDVSLDTICRDLDIDSIWPIATTEHNLVRSYGGRYYYEEVQNKDDDFIASYMKAFYCQARFLFASFQPDIVLTPNFVAPHHLIVEKMAECRGVRMIAASQTRVREICSFTYSYKGTDGPFVRRVRELQKRMAVSPNSERASGHIQKIREDRSKSLDVQRVEKKQRNSRIFREIESALKQSVMYLIKGGVNPMPNIGPTPDNRSPWYLFRDLFMARKYRREARSFQYTPLGSLGAFAYFPLQTQPEAQIDTVACYFNNQFETARLTAKSLPGDMTLAVKQHPGMLGKKGRRYCEKLSRTPNIKLVDYRVAPSELLERCDLVISAGGTSVVEAAYYGKPAIQFSDFAVTQLLPNVVRHSDFSSLSARISQVLALRPDPVEYEFRLNCFVAAALDVGLEIDYWGCWEYGHEIDMDQLYEHFEAEILRSCKETGRFDNYAKDKHGVCFSL